MQVDGQNLGDRWQTLWEDPTRHALRDREIEQWLSAWSSWPDRIEQTQGWGQMRSSGVQLRQPDPDTANVLLRHPPLRDDATEALWRLQGRRRGDEWLLAAIDHRPKARGLP